MSVLEQEIIERFRQLDNLATQPVIEQLTPDMQPTLDDDSWWLTVETLQASLQSRSGTQATVGILALLDELRSESS